MARATSRPPPSLLPDVPVERLVGIARLASEAEPISEGHNVEYLTMAARTILNRCTAKYMPFAWTINPYRGCEFGCKYCYARFTHEFMELRDSLDFERRIFIKQQTGWLLRHELKKVKRGESIAIGTATDPYQPAERKFEATRAVLQELALHSALSIGLVTKSQTVTRDIELFQEIARRNDLTINITITTMNADLARILEPRAPRPDLRMQAVATLVNAGIHAGVICAPVLPGITDHPSGLSELVKASAEAGARFIYPNPLFLKPCSEKIFLPFLQQHFPHLVKDYRKRFKQSGYVTPSYRKRLGDLLNALCNKHGMPDREARRDFRAKQTAVAEERVEQMRLFYPWPSAAAWPSGTMSCLRTA